MADLLGFVGVGRMGGPMANRLLDAGYRLDRSSTTLLTWKQKRSKPYRASMRRSCSLT